MAAILKPIVDFLWSAFAALLIMIMVTTLVTPVALRRCLRRRKSAALP